MLAAFFLQTVLQLVAIESNVVGNLVAAEDWRKAASASEDRLPAEFGMTNAGQTLYGELQISLTSRSLCANGSS